ncbi:MAG TPA: helicase HerA-like domain-containing protein, partial [Hanamia sp.]|nr:helicase HerA-like domain-containing protein [Hanamia sp.]
MDKKADFLQAIKNGYTFKGETIKIGAGMLDDEVIAEAEVFIPLSTMNRHGLIAGATGGGKTKTFQMIAEGLSD